MIDGAMQDYPLTLDRFLTHAAKWHGEAEVVTAGLDGVRRRATYAQIAERSRTVSSVLEALGARTGDRVATLAWNTQAHLEVWYAIMGMGAVCHTLNPRLTADDLAHMVVQSEARLIVVSADLLPLARAIAGDAPGVARLMVIDGDAPPASEPVRDVDVVALEPLLAETRQGAIWGELPETAPCALCFTSGTTGRPKGVTYTHRSSFLHALRMLQADAMAISRSDRVLMAVPMFHASAWGLPFVAPAVGGGLVLPGRRADGASLADLIEQEGVTVGVAVPTVWSVLVEHVEATGRRLPTLERIIMGGAPLQPRLMERVESRLGATVQMSWGMTELSPAGAVMPRDEPHRPAHMSGRPAIGVDLLLKDADGAPLPEQRGREGHLYVKGAAVIERYFGHAEKATDDDGWFPTGDLARIEPDGQLVITGRAKDLIKSGGEWINPAAIEAVVGAVPGVSLAAVIGRPDPKWGERPVLVVEAPAREAVTDEALLAPLRDRVPPWWIPDEIVRVSTMPLAPTGKIDKSRLRVEYGGG